MWPGRLLVVLRDNRMFAGTLRSFDQFGMLNISCCESVMHFVPELAPFACCRTPPLLQRLSVFVANVVLEHTYERVYVGARQVLVSTCLV